VSNDDQSLDRTFQTTNNRGSPVSTFEQEILGEAASDKDDRVEAKPGDNDHQDDNDNDDNDDDGDGGGFTGSASGSQSGARSICHQ
jgi:hypothetical protein